MVFKCQEDSFLKEHTAIVISCECATSKPGNLEGDIKGFNVVLNETILFPEGGGQPCDHGTLNGKPVTNVFRDGSQAVLFVETSKPFLVGERVKQIINWERRLDHMQQHSGQHLITALFDQKYGYDTKSWWLGNEASYIELNAKDVSKDELSYIEKLANELIIEGRMVSVAVTSKEDGLKFQDMRAPRGLPPDHVGPVRIVTIEGIESNMCCGTHVSNLSQLQVVKLLHVEKPKNKLFVHFLIGNRVIRKLDECYTRELQLNLLLKGGSRSHLDLIKKIQANLKNTQKAFQKLIKEIAVLEANKFKTKTPPPAYYSLHRQDGIEPDFITTFLRHVPDGVFYFLTVSDDSGKGHMVLRGEPILVSKFGPIFTELLSGKGNSKGNNFQAKFNDIKKLFECEVLLKENFLGI